MWNDYIKLVNTSFTSQIFFCGMDFLKIIFFSFFYWSIVDTQCYISFRLQHSDSTSYLLCYAHHKCRFYLSPYSAIEVTLTIFPMLYLLSSWHSFHNWKPVSPTPFHPFCFPLPPLFSSNHRFSVFLSLSAFGLFICFVF